MTGVPRGPALTGSSSVDRCVGILPAGMISFPGDSGLWEVLTVSDIGDLDTNFSSEHILFGKEI